MTVERTPLPRRGARLQRAVTLNRLLRAKTVGFLGGLSLLVNAMSGPGIPFVPALFQKSGWVLPIFAFVVFTIVSSLSVLFIVEAMQAIPGNKHFQGTVEFGTLINFYFGKKAHLTGQFFLYGALISQAVQSIVLTSQAADDITRRIFGNTWGLVINNGLRWDHSGSGLFDQPVLFTVGYLVTIVLTIPLGFVNLDDNIQIQIGAFFLMFVVLLHWIVASFTSPEVFKPSRLLPIGDELSSVAGVVLLNLAFTVVVPSWINLKRKDVNAQLTVWSATTIMSTLYIIFGIIGAMGYEGLDGDFLKTLRERSNPAAIALASTYAFTFCMLLPGIPVNFQVARQNLTQNRVMGKYPAMFVCFVLPLFIVIPFLRNGSLQAFVDWTSLLFVSTANFVFPLVIYLRCLTFRKDYNASRVLNVKQKLLLKEIHWSSRTIQNFINSYNARIGQLDAELGSPQTSPRPSSVKVEDKPKEKRSDDHEAFTTAGTFTSDAHGVHSTGATPSVLDDSGQSKLASSGTLYDSSAPFGQESFGVSQDSGTRPRLKMRVTIALRDERDDSGAPGSPVEQVSEDAVIDSTVITRKRTKKSLVPGIAPVGYLDPRYAEERPTSVDAGFEGATRLADTTGDRPGFARTLTRLAMRGFRGTSSNTAAGNANDFGATVHAGSSSNEVDLITESEAAALVLLLDEDVPDPEQDRGKADHDNFRMLTLNRKTLGRKGTAAASSSSGPSSGFGDSDKKKQSVNAAPIRGDEEAPGSLKEKSPIATAATLERTEGGAKFGTSLTVPSALSVRKRSSDNSILSVASSHSTNSTSRRQARVSFVGDDTEDSDEKAERDAAIEAAAIKAAEEAFLRKRATVVKGAADISAVGNNSGASSPQIKRLTFETPEDDNLGSPERGDGEEFDRRQTLPSHPKFVAPPFRTIPLWLPVRARVVAHVVLWAMVAFIIVNFGLLVYPKNAKGNSAAANGTNATSLASFMGSAQRIGAAIAPSAGLASANLDAWTEANDGHLGWDYDDDGQAAGGLDSGSSPIRIDVESAPSLGRRRKIRRRSTKHERN